MFSYAFFSSYLFAQSTTSSKQKSSNKRPKQKKPDSRSRTFQQNRTRSTLRPLRNKIPSKVFFTFDFIFISSSEKLSRKKQGEVFVDLYFSQAAGFHSNFLVFPYCVQFQLRFRLLGSRRTWRLLLRFLWTKTY